MSQRSQETAFAAALKNLRSVADLSRIARRPPIFMREIDVISRVTDAWSYRRGRPELVEGREISLRIRYRLFGRCIRERLVWSRFSEFRLRESVT